MKTKKEKIKELLANAEDDGGQWLEKARYRRENRGWLRKSQQVAIKVLRTLDKKGMQQKELAEAMDVSPQQVSKIVKGKQNLTLQTIARLEQVLGISLFEVPRQSYKMNVAPKRVINKNYKKSSEKYGAREPLKNVVNGSWNSKDKKQSYLRLVEDA